MNRSYSQDDETPSSSSAEISEEDDSGDGEWRHRKSSNKFGSSGNRRGHVRRGRPPTRGASAARGGHVNPSVDFTALPQSSKAPRLNQRALSAIHSKGTMSALKQQREQQPQIPSRQNMNISNKGQQMLQSESPINEYEQISQEIENHNNINNNNNNINQQPPKTTFKIKIKQSGLAKSKSDANEQTLQNNNNNNNIQQSSSSIQQYNNDIFNSTSPSSYRTRSRSPPPYNRTPSKVNYNQYNNKEQDEFNDINYIDNDNIDNDDDELDFLQEESVDEDGNTFIDGEEGRQQKICKVDKILATREIQETKQQQQQDEDELTNMNNENDDGQQQKNQQRQSSHSPNRINTPYSPSSKRSLSPSQQTMNNNRQIINQNSNMNQINNKNNKNNNKDKISPNNSHIHSNLNIQSPSESHSPPPIQTSTPYQPSSSRSYSQSQQQQSNYSSSSQQQSETLHNFPLVQIPTIEQLHSDPETQDYLVKWKNQSYIHCEWITFQRLQQEDQLWRNRIKQYVKKMEEKMMEGDLGEGIMNSDELFEPFPPEYVEVERIIDENIEEQEQEVEQEEEDEEQKEMIKDVEIDQPNQQEQLSQNDQNEKKLIKKIEKVQKVQYLVKWKSLPYEEASWEWETEIENEDKIREFKIRQEQPPLNYKKRYNYKDPMKMNVVEIQKHIKQSVESVYKNDNTLRQYQVEGLHWMLFNWFQRRNQILADEMGLGKTAQSVCLLQHLARKEKLEGPFLIIAPLSTLPHWQREIERWTDLNAIVYHGSTTSRHLVREYEWNRKQVIKQSQQQQLEPQLAQQQHLIPTIRQQQQLQIQHQQNQQQFDFKHYLNQQQTLPQQQQDNQTQQYSQLRQQQPEQQQQQNQNKTLATGLGFEVIITTYEMVMVDMFYFKTIPWKFMVLDEAHRLKSSKSKTFNELKGLKSDSMLLLTGTPLQNNLTELFTLLNFLDEKTFPQEEEFMGRFGQLSEQSEKIQELHQILRPFLLRRIKDEVEESIPIKQETIIEVELTKLQKQYYKAIHEKNFQFLSQGAKLKNVPNLLNVMMELRKCCNHPFLIKGAEDSIIRQNQQEFLQQQRQQSSSSQQLIPQQNNYLQLLIKSSGKFVLLDKLLPRLYDEGHKVLIFSQMTRMLDRLQQYLRLKGYIHERIDGSVKVIDRQAAIDRFSKEGSNRFVFLLCTRAGGLGINLTSADIVIIYDSDWNPQNDIQAQARCHRIGQTKNVTVYRLITKNTYEAFMFEQASLKLGLDHAVMSGIRQQGQQLNKNQLDKLLKRGAYDAFREENEKDDEDEEDDDQDQKDGLNEQDKENKKQKKQQKLSKFELSTIDDILNKSKIVNYDKNKQGDPKAQDKKKDLFSLFSKVTFMTIDGTELKENENNESNQNKDNKSGNRQNSSNKNRNNNDDIEIEKYDRKKELERKKLRNKEEKGRGKRKRRITIKIKDGENNSKDLNNEQGFSSNEEEDDELREQKQRLKQQMSDEQREKELEDPDFWQKLLPNAFQLSEYENEQQSLFLLPRLRERRENDKKKQKKKEKKEKRRKEKQQQQQMGENGELIIESSSDSSDSDDDDDDEEEEVYKFNNPNDGTYQDTTSYTRKMRQGTWGVKDEDVDEDYTDNKQQNKQSEKDKDRKQQEKERQWQRFDEYRIRDALMNYGERWDVIREKAFPKKTLEETKKLCEAMLYLFLKINDKQEELNIRQEKIQQLHDQITEFKANGKGNESSPQLIHLEQQYNQLKLKPTQLPIWISLIQNAPMSNIDQNIQQLKYDFFNPKKVGEFAKQWEKCRVLRRIVTGDLTGEREQQIEEQRYLKLDKPKEKERERERNRKLDQIEKLKMNIEAQKQEKLDKQKNNQEDEDDEQEEQNNQQLLLLQKQLYGTNNVHEDTPTNSYVGNLDQQLPFLEQMISRTSHIPFWWTPLHDRAFIIGVWRHGFNGFDLIRDDPELPFLQKVGESNFIQKEKERKEREKQREKERREIREKEKKEQRDKKNGRRNRKNQLQNQLDNNNKDNMSDNENQDKSDKEEEFNKDEDDVDKDGKDKEKEQDDKSGWPQVSILRTRLRVLLSNYQKKEQQYRDKDQQQREKMLNKISQNMINQNQNGNLKKDRKKKPIGNTNASFPNTQSKQQTQLPLINNNIRGAVNISFVPHPLNMQQQQQPQQQITLEQIQNNINIMNKQPLSLNQNINQVTATQLQQIHNNNINKINEQQINKIPNNSQNSTLKSQQSALQASKSKLNTSSSTSSAPSLTFQQQQQLYEQQQKHQQLLFNQQTNSKRKLRQQVISVFEFDIIEIMSILIMNDKMNKINKLNENQMIKDNTDLQRNEINVYANAFNFNLYNIFNTLYSVLSSSQLSLLSSDILYKTSQQLSNIQSQMQQKSKKQTKLQLQQQQNHSYQLKQLLQLVNSNFVQLQHNNIQINFTTKERKKFMNFASSYYLPPQNEEEDDESEIETESENEYNQNNENMDENQIEKKVNDQENVGQVKEKEMIKDFEKEENSKTQNDDELDKIFGEQNKIDSNQINDQDDIQSPSVESQSSQSSSYRHHNIQILKNNLPFALALSSVSKYNNLRMSEIIEQLKNNQEVIKEEEEGLKLNEKNKKKKEKIENGQTNKDHYQQQLILETQNYWQNFLKDGKFAHKQPLSLFLFYRLFEMQSEKVFNNKENREQYVEGNEEQEEGEAEQVVKIKGKTKKDDKRGKPKKVTVNKNAKNVSNDVNNNANVNQKSKVSVKLTMKGKKKAKMNTAAKSSQKITVKVKAKQQKPTLIMEAQMDKDDNQTVKDDDDNENNGEQNDNDNENDTNNQNEEIFSNSEDDDQEQEDEQDNENQNEQQTSSSQQKTPTKINQRKKKQQKENLNQKTEQINSIQQNSNTPQQLSKQQASKQSEMNQLNQTIAQQFQQSNQQKQSSSNPLIQQQPQSLTSQLTSNTLLPTNPLHLSPLNVPSITTTNTTNIPISAYPYSMHTSPINQQISPNKPPSFPSYMNMNMNKSINFSLPLSSSQIGSSALNSSQQTTYIPSPYHSSSMTLQQQQQLQQHQLQLQQQHQQQLQKQIQQNAVNMQKNLMLQQKQQQLAQQQLQLPNQNQQQPIYKPSNLENIQKDIEHQIQQKLQQNDPKHDQTNDELKDKNEQENNVKKENKDQIKEEELKPIQHQQLQQPFQSPKSIIMPPLASQQQKYINLINKQNNISSNNVISNNQTIGQNIHPQQQNKSIIIVSKDEISIVHSQQQRQQHLQSVLQLEISPLSSSILQNQQQIQHQQQLQQQKQPKQQQQQQQQQQLQPLQKPDSPTIVVPKPKVKLIVINKNKKNENQQKKDNQQMQQKIQQIDQLKKQNLNEFSQQQQFSLVPSSSQPSTSSSSSSSTSNSQSFSQQANTNLIINNFEFVTYRYAEKFITYRTILRDLQTYVYPVLPFIKKFPVLATRSRFPQWWPCEQLDYYLIISTIKYALFWQKGFLDKQMKLCWFIPLELRRLLKRIDKQSNKYEMKKQTSSNKDKKKEKGKQSQAKSNPKSKQKSNWRPKQKKSKGRRKKKDNEDDEIDDYSSSKDSLNFSKSQSQSTSHNVSAALSSYSYSSTSFTMFTCDDEDESSEDEDEKEVENQDIQDDNQSSSSQKPEILLNQNEEFMKHQQKQQKIKVKRRVKPPKTVVDAIEKVRQATKKNKNAQQQNQQGQNASVDTDEQQLLQVQKEFQYQQPTRNSTNQLNKQQQGNIQKQKQSQQQQQQNKQLQRKVNMQSIDDISSLPHTQVIIQRLQLLIYLFKSEKVVEMLIKGEMQNENGKKIRFNQRKQQVLYSTSQPSSSQQQRPIFHVSDDGTILLLRSVVKQSQIQQPLPAQQQQFSNLYQSYQNLQPIEVTTSQIPPFTIAQIPSFSNPQIQAQQQTTLQNLYSNLQTQQPHTLQQQQQQQQLQQQIKQISKSGSKTNLNVKNKQTNPTPQQLSTQTVQYYNQYSSMYNTNSFFQFNSVSQQALQNSVVICYADEINNLNQMKVKIKIQSREEKKIKKKIKEKEQIKDLDLLKDEENKIIIEIQEKFKETDQNQEPNTEQKEQSDMNTNQSDIISKYIRAKQIVENKWRYIEERITEENEREKNEKKNNENNEDIKQEQEQEDENNKDIKDDEEEIFPWDEDNGTKEDINENKNYNIKNEELEEQKELKQDIETKDELEEDESALDMKKVKRKREQNEQKTSKSNKKVIKQNKIVENKEKQNKRRRIDEDKAEEVVLDKIQDKIEEQVQEEPEEQQQIQVEQPYQQKMRYIRVYIPSLHNHQQSSLQHQQIQSSILQQQLQQQQQQLLQQQQSINQQQSLQIKRQISKLIKQEQQIIINQLSNFNPSSVSKQNPLKIGPITVYEMGQIVNNNNQVINIGNNIQENIIQKEKNIKEQPNNDNNFWYDLKAIYPEGFACSRKFLLRKINNKENVDQQQTMMNKDNQEQTMKEIFLRITKDEQINRPLFVIYTINNNEAINNLLQNQKNGETLQQSNEQQQQIQFSSQSYSISEALTTLSQIIQDKTGFEIVDCKKIDE